jgi:hypothetical protein
MINNYQNYTCINFYDERSTSFAENNVINNTQESIKYGIISVNGAIAEIKECCLFKNFKFLFTVFYGTLEILNSTIDDKYYNFSVNQGAFSTTEINSNHDIMISCFVALAYIPKNERHPKCRFTILNESKLVSLSVLLSSLLLI